MGELNDWTEIIKKNSPQTLMKAPPSSNGCCGTGVGSGININFCPIINPKISPTIQPEIKPIIYTLFSDDLREMEREHESPIEQPERIGCNSSSSTSICVCDKGEQNQDDPVVFRQRHSSL
jgi:hypothetical protein